ncbi:MAG TPA: D-2-hydroxyacid dehydrogenase [Vicinamibacteria bacterium]|nr:D-2-hydroxyacid dehydrogenase [Vicinamibacteria bacterium]
MLRVVVLAEPDDTSLRLLQAVDAGVRFHVGQDAVALADQAPDAEALLYCTGGRERLEAAFTRLLRLRWVHSRWAGLDGLLFPALAESPVVLTNSRGVFSRALAEFAIGAILHFAKDFARMRRQQAARRWEPFVVEEIGGRSLGIVGYGDIGRAVAERGKALGMRILAMRRRDVASDGLVDEAFAPEERLGLVARSDAVVLALPLTDETRGLFGAREIAAMKPSAVLVNVGRGPTLDEPALVAALQARRIRGAALDVFAEEPLPRDSPLWDLDNVLVSPHTADRTTTWLDEAMAVFLDNLGRFRAGRPLRNVVEDKRRGY